MHEGIVKAFPGPPVPGDFVPRDVYLDGRWTGTLDLAFDVSSRSPLVIGSGLHDVLIEETPGLRRLQKVGKKRVWVQDPPKREELLVAEIVRRRSDATPVIPGSSVKGAVRQVYELLTSSCEPGVRGLSCVAQPRDEAPRVCPACSLFGAMGLAGRIGFGEAEPAGGPSAARVEVRRVPAAWGDQQSVAGTYRFYDGKRAEGENHAPRAEDEAVWAVSGVFRMRLRVINASDDELGLLFASLGMGAPGAGPSLRLGGKKYHGFGGVAVRLLRARTRCGEGRPGGEEELAAWGRVLIETALGAEDAPRRRAWSELHGVLARGA